MTRLIFDGIDPPSRSLLNALMKAVEKASLLRVACSRICYHIGLKS
jgi:hypothetical protein